jgi:hypothetical protein
MLPAVPFPRAAGTAARRVGLRVAGRALRQLAPARHRRPRGRPPRGPASGFLANAIRLQSEGARLRAWRKQAEGRNGACQPFRSASDLIADSARANEDLSATVDPLITTSSVRTVRSPERTIRTVAQLPHTDTRGPASVTLRPGPATGTPGDHQNPLPLAAITNCPRASPIIRCGSPAGRTRSTGTCHTIASRWCRSARCGGPIMSTPQVAAPRLAGTARAPAGSQLVLAE